MVSKISKTAQLMPKFNYAHKTQVQQYVPKFIEMCFPQVQIQFNKKIEHTNLSLLVRYRNKCNVSLGLLFSWLMTYN
jgi:hypothetical protein